MPDVSTIREVRMRRIAPGSAFVLGLLVALVASLVIVVVLSLMYLLLNKLGVVSSLNQSLSDLVKVRINFVYVLYGAAAIAIWNFLTIPILFAVSSWIYNLCAAISGGVRTTVYELADK